MNKQLGEITMKFNKIMTCLLIMIVSFMFISATSAYTGTGFSHDIPDNYYSQYSTSDLLNKYNNTYLTSEKRGVCTHVVDGDTIYLASGEKVRLVGVNTPERGVKGYQASKNFVSKLCLNKEVGINVDDRKYRDKYGRTLAVVIVDGKNLNEMLLKEHLAEVMYIPPSEFTPQKWADGTTQTAQATTTAQPSQQSNNSIQSAQKQSTSSDTSTYIGNSNSYKFHKADCEAVSKMSEKNKVILNSRDDAINSGYKPCKMCNP